ncbi:hypothetical protein DNTS_025341 [Danionella cerebrum]|uniref:Protein kinase domain-containing protein n=1 Tax=Danionella cerebrum TaxID=2873325 RepID=A0A553NKD8_9TELE|nr:hypothetical protein DNTS_025341 [Danionella translucida]
MAQDCHLPIINEQHLQNIVLVRTSVNACLRGLLGTNKVAVKLLNDRKWIDRLNRAGILGQVSSERILVPLGLFEAHSVVGLVRDWMTQGSLHSLLHERDLFPELSTAVCLQILSDVAEGLAQLHALSLPHGALKSTNVLLDQQFHAKLCDWGQEVDLHSSAPNGRGPRHRDLPYVSPEVLLGSATSIEADLYSFGVLLWETLNRKQPCDDIDLLQTKLELGVPVELLPPTTPQKHVLTQLIIRCLNSEPQKRPSAAECALVLRETVAAIDPQMLPKAILHLKSCKNKSCKRTSKNWTSKIMPQPETLPMPSSQNLQGKVSPPVAIRTRSQTGGCRVEAGNRAVHSNNGRQRIQTQQSTSLRSPCLSPTTLNRISQVQGNQVNSQLSADRRCCRLLLERREAIVRYMTEGRFNNLLDVLRARQAVNHETYEIITAGLTLTARTRCLLDICSCLGENVAMLVATTLGLVSTDHT